MKLTNTIAFVTGANRGLGRSFVDALLERGAAKVYAASRDGKTAFADPRVVPIALDITNVEEARAAAQKAADTKLLVNNAGVLASYSVLTSELDKVREDLEVNFHGLLNVTRAFAPNLSEGAAIANVLSVVSMASMPALGGYSASKAAAWSLTQSIREELRPRGIRVHAAFPGPIDTDMIRAFEMSKTSPAEVARAILDGIAADREDISPDPMSTDALATYLRDPRELARRFAS